MEDIWQLFPVTMGDHQAWISYNHSYAAIAEKDDRSDHIRIRIDLKNPTDEGMPTDEEFPHLVELDQKLEVAFKNAGGIYVGRITVDGYRFFYFYLSADEDKACGVAKEIIGSRGYEFDCLYKNDPHKQSYWNELYPTDDDFQVIKDLAVLERLAKNGDDHSIERTINHWAYFSDADQCAQFTDWATQQKYSVQLSGIDEDSKFFLVQYDHTGTVLLRDIIHHTISANRMAREIGGRYDGWGTSLQKP